MIDVKCDCCGNSLTAAGALLFSPVQGSGSVHKYHLCQSCWQVVAKLVAHPTPAVIDLRARSEAR